MSRDRQARRLQRHAQRLERPARHAVLFAQESEQERLGADVTVAQRAGLLLRAHHDLASVLREPFKHPYSISPRRSVPTVRGARRGSSAGRGHGRIDRAVTAPDRLADLVLIDPGSDASRTAVRSRVNASHTSSMSISVRLSSSASAAAAINNRRSGTEGTIWTPPIERSTRSTTGTGRHDPEGSIRPAEPRPRLRGSPPDRDPIPRARISHRDALRVASDPEQEVLGPDAFVPRASASRNDSSSASFASGENGTWAPGRPLMLPDRETRSPAVGANRVLAHPPRPKTSAAPAPAHEARRAQDARPQ